MKAGKHAKDYTFVFTRVILCLKTLGHLQGDTVKSEGLTATYLKGVKVDRIIKEALSKAFASSLDRPKVFEALKDLPAEKKKKRGGILFDREGFMDREEGEGGGRMKDRVALLCHAICDTECQALLKKIQIGPSNSSTAAMLDSGANVARRGWWDEVAKIAMKNRSNYVNEFTDECLKDIDPSKGVFVDGAQFKALKTEYMGKYNTLKLSTQSTGSNHSGSDLDRWVLDHKLGPKERCKDLSAYYAWLYFNAHQDDMVVVSTACPPGVGCSAGFAHLQSPTSTTSTTTSSATSGGGSGGTTTGAGTGLPPRTRKEKHEAKRMENMKEMVATLGAILPAVMGGAQPSVLDSSEKRKNNAMASAQNAQASYFVAKTATEEKNAGMKRLQDTLRDPLIMEHVSPNSKKQMVKDLVAMTTGRGI